jgi:phenylpropionate dioxygenase-like ring-hydroxylating dioxygenase large terminal subunit
MSFLRNGWYCAGWSEEVGREPFARTLLGNPVLLFRRQDGTATALSDACPHRFAPLHKGRLEGDRISCPYHGLTFDASGQCVFNPHSDGRIPPAARLRVYPLLESQGAVWLWMGDPDLADPTKIVDLNLVPGHVMHGYLNMKSNYLMVLDNLLDLSHAPYLHSGTLSPVGTRRETTYEATDTTAKSIYKMPSVPTPATQRPFFDGPIGDFYTTIDWTVPTVLRQFLCFTGVDRPQEEGAISRAAHILTPQDEHTTHYFWAASRNRHQDNAQIDAKIRSMVEYAFINEDGPMMEACERYMGTTDLLSLKPAFLQVDLSAVRARRTLSRLIKAEAGESPTSTEPQAHAQDGQFA